MTGFGQGPFGRAPFGEHYWSKKVLFDSLPEIYKRTDEVEYDGVLEKWSKVPRPSFDDLRLRIRRYDSLRDPYQTRGDTTESAVIRLGAQKPVRGVVEQSGSDGSVEIGTRRFLSSSARFTAQDIGKELILTNAETASNRLPARVTAIISQSAVTTNPALSPETGPIRWELRAFTEAVDFAIFEVQEGDVSQVAPGWELRDGRGVLAIEKRRQFYVSDVENSRLTEKEGRDAIVNPDGTISIPTGAFVQRDVGKKLTLAGSSIESNVTKAVIAKVISPTVISPSYTVVRGRSNTRGNVAYHGVRFDLGGLVPEIRHVIRGESRPLQVEFDGVSKATVFPATNSAGEPVSTATEVVAAVNAHAQVSLFLRASVDYLGTGAVGLSGYAPVVGLLLEEDVGPLHWALLRRPELTTDTRTVPNGFVEREGTDLEVVVSSNPAEFVSEAGRFQDIDIGKFIYLRGSTVGNDAPYEILDVLDLTRIKVRGGLTPPPPGELHFWEIRSRTNLGDETQVQVNAPAVLPVLARDFGLEVDSQESEARQRACVHHVARWIDKKGNFDSYRILGLLSGFDVTVEGLWRVTPEFYSIHPEGNTFEYGESRGTEGSLLPGTLDRVRFYVPAGGFAPDDIGKQIRIENAAVVGNNKLYTIEAVLDAQTVEFLKGDTAVVPDGNNEALVWTKSKLFVVTAPLLPSHDEFNADALEFYIETRYGLPDFFEFGSSGLFTIDKFCFEDGWTTDMETFVDSVQVVSSTEFFVVINVTPPYADVVEIFPDPGTIERVPLVRLTDSLGHEFFMETFPEYLGGGQGRFKVISAQTPATGAANMELICTPLQLGCDYCAASVILATIEAQTITNDEGVQAQEQWERVLDRLEQEAKPRHVTLITKLVQTLEASLQMQASGLVDVLPALEDLVMEGNGTMEMGAIILKTSAIAMTGEGFMTMGLVLNVAGASEMDGVGTMTMSASVY